MKKSHGVSLLLRPGMIAVLILMLSFVSAKDSYADSLTWSTKASLPTAVSLAAAAELNGKIYLLGGSTDSGSTASVQMYDPSTDSWQPKPSLPEPRFDGAEVVQGNTVYIAGGDGAVSSIISYDLNTGSGSSIGSLVTGRMRASAAIINNKMYVVGGSNGGTAALDTIEEFDFTLRTSSMKTIMPAPRQQATVVPVQGKLYILGGLDGSGLPVNTCWEYDPATDVFTEKSSLPTAVGTKTYVVANGKIYLIGGVTDSNGPLTWMIGIQEYTPDTDSWRLIGSFPTSRHAAVAQVVNNILYIMGGDDGQPLTPNILSVSEAVSLAPGLVSPLDYDFGNVDIFSTSPNQAFTLSNSSAANLMFSSITLLGTDAGQFSVTPGSCPSLTPTIMPGGGCTVNVSFAPTAAGVKNAALQIISNDAAAPTVNVPLGGTGITFSTMQSEGIDITPPKTTASPAGGIFAAPQAVTLTVDEPAIIYYTINGEEPTTASPVYGGPIDISVSTTLRFFAVDTAGNAESVKFEMYIIDSGSGSIDVWSAVGSMATSRAGHTATLLANGKVLVAGGNDYGSYLSSAELYDPAGKSWSSAGSMAVAREGHTATLLPNGKVLVAGGENVFSAELYDPATNSWSSAGSMTYARFYHTATLLPDGKVLVAGGWNFVNDRIILYRAELYDPSSNTWTTVGSMMRSRFGHTATLLPNGKVLVTGGTNGSIDLSVAETYDPATSSWSLVNPMATARFRPTATLLQDGKLLVAGGANNGGGTQLSSAELYDPASNSWSSAGSMATAREWPTATLLPNGKVLVAGGYYGGRLSSAELYDPLANSWLSAGSMAIAHGGHTATLLLNGRVLVAGGGVASAELYGPDPTTIASPPAGTYNTPQTVTLTANKPATIYYTTNGDDPTTASLIYSGPISISTSTTVKYFASDPAGNSETIKSAVYVIDMTAPVTTPSIAGGLYATPQTVTLTADKPSTIYYTIDGVDPTTASSVYSGPVTIYSSLTLKFFARDAVGNEEDVKAESYVITASGVPVSSWSDGGAMTSPRMSHTATLLPNGKVLVLGGDNGEYYGVLSSTEMYDFVSNSWSSADAMLNAREDHTATLLSNGKVLVVGGYTDNYNETSYADIYDPNSNSWSYAGSMATSRRSHTATLLPNGKVLVTGGHNYYDDGLSSAELYDPVTNSWSSAGSMADGREHHTATLLPDGKVLIAGGYEYGGYILSSTELYDPATNSWSSASPMTTGREYHTATLLPNGKVLVAGGYDKASAELYDPSADSWSLAGSMTTHRFGHTATLLTNGKVLVAGRYNYDGYSVSSELYDPASNSWSSAGFMMVSRGDHTATLLPTGKVLVAGGYQNSSTLSSVELYDPAGDPIPPVTIVSPVAGTYSSTQAVKLTANEAATIYYTIDGTDPTTASLVYSEPVSVSSTTTLKYFARDAVGNSEAIKSATYIIDNVPPVSTPSHPGGTYPAPISVALASSETATIYYSTDGSDPDTDSSVYTGPITILGPTTLKYFAIDVVGNREAVQSQTYEISDQGPFTWFTKAPLPYGVSRAVSAVSDGRIFILGGSPTTASVISFDPVENSWRYHPPLPIPIFGGAAVAQHTTIYLLGGIDEQWNYLNSVIAYNTIDGTSTTVGTLTHARARMNASLLNNKIYVVGGSNAPDTIEEFDLATNSSRIVATLPEATVLAGVAPYQSKLIIAGGGSDNRKTWSFDPASGEFTTLSPLPLTAEGRNLIVNNDRLYLVEGWGYDNINYVFEYNMTNDSWTIATSVPTLRNVPMVEAVNGIMYVMGGDSAGGSNLNEAWQFGDGGWTVNSVNPYRTDMIDWQVSQHGTVVVGTNIKIGSTFYYVTESDFPSWSGADYIRAALSDCDQITGVPTSPADMTGSEGRAITYDSNPPLVTATPAGGTYSMPQAVTLTADKPGTIYYTTDGTDPTFYSPVYSGPLYISSSKTLKFFASDLSGVSGPVMLGNYFITGVQGWQVHDVKPGESSWIDWLSDQQGYVPAGEYLYVNDTLYYVYQSEAASWNGAGFNSVKLQQCDQTTRQPLISIVQCGEQCYDDGTGSWTCMPSYCSAPVFADMTGATGAAIATSVPPLTSVNPPGGNYPSPITVSLIPNVPASIYYTTDGSYPTTASPVYTGPILISTSTNLQFFAMDGFGNSENIRSEIYTMSGSWTINSVYPLTGSGIDWLATQHSTVPVGSYLKINNVFYYVSGSNPGTWGDSSNTAYNTAWLQQCDQITGSPLVNPSDPENMLLPNLSGSAGVAIELYPSFPGVPEDQTGWSAAGSMATARSGHTATLLNNGKLLVAGGYDFSSLPNAELHDAAGKSWSTVGSMATGRTDHTATLLMNGNVLVTGGNANGSNVSIAELFDPATNSWSSAGSLATAREKHTATLLKNGKVLVTGGGYRYGVYSSAELYDPATNSWSSASAMAIGRYMHTATLLPNGKVLIVGGGNGYGTYFSSAELYDPATNSWSAAGTMSTARDLHTATLLHNGKVLVAGGENGGYAVISSAELYDPASNSWSSAGTITTPRIWHTATKLQTGKVLLAGGWGNDIYLASSEIYDPESNSWKAVESMATSRLGLTATLLPNGKVLAVGGVANDNFIYSAELYTPEADLTPPVTTATPPGGTYTTPQVVSLTSNEPATIYYTIDGTDPTTASAIYSGPITVSTAVLKFFAKDAAGNSESIQTETYITKIDQTITFPALQPRTYGDASFTLEAIASSGLPVSYASDNIAVATVSGNVITIVGAGTVNITARQAGNSYYNSASAVTQPLLVNKAPATLVLGNLNTVYDGKPKAASVTTIPPGLPVIITYNDSPIAPTAVGVYTVVATINSANYEGSGTDNLAISQATTAISINPPSPNLSTYGQSVTLSATVSPVGASGKVEFSNGTGWIQQVDVNVVSGSVSFSSSAIPAGINTITARYLGDNNHTQSSLSTGITLIVNKANQTVNFAALETKIAGGLDFTLNATASSGLEVTFISSDTAVAQVTGNTVTIVGPGTTTIIASQWGDSNYNAASAVFHTLTVISAEHGIKLNDNGSDSYFSTLSAAYNGISSGTNASIQLPITTLTEAVVFDKSYELTIMGGYDPLLGIYSGVTTIQGSITIQNGTVIIAEPLCIM